MTRAATSRPTRGRSSVSGPLADWSGGAAALVFAGRLAGNVGGDRLSHALTLRACRRLATDPRRHARRPRHRRAVQRLPRLRSARAARRAPSAGASRRGPPPSRPAQTTKPGPDVLCLHAHVAAAYRDTDAAETCWQAAHAPGLRPAPWTWARTRARCSSPPTAIPKLWTPPANPCVCNRGIGPPSSRPRTSSLCSVGTTKRSRCSKTRSTIKGADLKAGPWPVNWRAFTPNSSVRRTPSVLWTVTSR